MISGGLLILFLGLMATGGMVAFSDLKYRIVNEKLWVPAAVAAGFFYVTAGLPVQVYVLPFILASAFAGGIVFAAFRTKGFGGADLLAIITASMFPFLLLYAVAPAMILSYVGIKLHIWGGNGTPVAGLIGFLTVVILSLYLIV